MSPSKIPTIPERVVTFILELIECTNAFTVFGLISMRWAISLFVRPSTR